MGIDLTDIEADVAITTADYRGHEAKIEYRPSVMTPGAIKKFEGSRDFDEISAFVAELVVSWDITRGKKKVPLTQEGMDGLPLGLLQAVIFACMNDQDGVTRQERSGR